MALGKSLSPHCASASPLTPYLSFSFRLLALLGKEGLLFVQFPGFRWRPWGFQPCNNSDSHQFYHLSLIHRSDEPNLHKGMDVLGPCVNNVQQGAITTRLFSFWCVRPITSPGLGSGLIEVLFLLCDTGVTHSGVWHDLCLCGWPRSETWSASIWSVNQQALSICQVSLCSGLHPHSRFQSSWVPVSLAGLSALPFGVWNNQRPCTLLEIQIYMR